MSFRLISDRLHHCILVSGVFVLRSIYHLYKWCLCLRYHIHVHCTDKQNALMRECTFKIEMVLEIGVAGVNIYLNITLLALSDVLARLAQSVTP